MLRHIRGRNAEEAVAQFLTASGFSLLARNIKIGGHEIDLVARLDDLLVLVEVRYRGPGAFERPLASVGAAKKKRLLGAAARLWARHSRDRSLRRFRIDVASVHENEGNLAVELVRGAITAS